MTMARGGGLNVLLFAALHLAPCLQDECNGHAWTSSTSGRHAIAMRKHYAGPGVHIVSAPLRLRGGRSTALGQRLQNLQYVMKKDPEGYIPEVQGHLDSWKTSVQAWERAPTLPHQEFGELSVFLGSNIHHFPSVLGDFGPQLLALVKRNITDMGSDLRLVMAKAIAITTSRKSISVPDMCNVFFFLFHLPDKKLRRYLYATCLRAIKRFNAHSVNLDVNRGLQRQLASFLHDTDTRSGRVAISLMIELYRCGMWADAFMVNLIAAACFSRQSAVRVAALHFFLGIDEHIQQDDDDEVDDFGIHRNAAASAGGSRERIKFAQVKTTHNKRKKKALRAMFQEQQREDKRRRMGLEPTKKKEKGKQRGRAFTVLEHLHDPYAFAERLLLSLRRWGSALKFEHKLLMIELISRIMAEHRVAILEFYDWVVRYLTPQQQDLHKILAAVASSITVLTPPDTVGALIEHIARTFIDDRSRDVSIVIGLNAVREICVRQPLGMPPDLLSDLVDYNRCPQSPAQPPRPLSLSFSRDSTPCPLWRVLLTFP
jgi:protein SDA1